MYFNVEQFGTLLGRFLGFFYRIWNTLEQWILGFGTLTRLKKFTYGLVES
jgi:hypothetical protein